MFAALCKYGKHSALHSYCPTHELPIVDFICKRISQIESEFVSLTNTVALWCNDIISDFGDLSTWLKGDDLDTNSLHMMAFNILSFNQSTYVRRIVKPFSECLS